jgi:DNA-binding CsgD family transcriptional regulator
VATSGLDGEVSSNRCRVPKTANECRRTHLTEHGGEVEPLGDGSTSLSTGSHANRLAGESDGAGTLHSWSPRDDQPRASNEIGSAVRTVAAEAPSSAPGWRPDCRPSPLEREAHVRRDPGVAGLTEREREVLRLLGHGHSNHQIARSLGLTVQNYVSHILDKLQVSDRTRAALWLRGDGGG